MRLQGKVALITGAATGEKDGVKGIGGATAWAFAREGAKLAVTDIDDELGERTVAQINESGSEAIYVHLDVKEEGQWIDAVRATVDWFGRLDILVNNAGYGSRDAHSPIEKMPVGAWDDLVEVNGRGAFLGTKHAVPEIRKSGGGSIVNVSSIDAIIGEQMTISAYQAGKGAMRIFTKAAAIEYAKENIRVNSVHPGYTDTVAATKIQLDQEIRDAILAKIPMGRRAKPEDMANGILFLASAESSYITGAELVIDGGVTAQ